MQTHSEVVISAHSNLRPVFLWLAQRTRRRTSFFSMILFLQSTLTWEKLFWKNAYLLVPSRAELAYSSHTLYMCLTRQTTFMSWMMASSQKKGHTRCLDLVLSHNLPSYTVLPGADEG